MNRIQLTKVVTTIFVLPVVFFLLAVINEGLEVSTRTLYPYIILSLIGGTIGGVYAYSCHKLFLKSSLLASLLPVAIFIVGAINLNGIETIILGDLCLVLSCILVASEVALARNTSLKKTE